MVLLLAALTLATVKIDGFSQPWDVNYGAGAVWASNEYDSTVSRIDPKTNRVVKTISVPGPPACVRTTSTAVWVGIEGKDDVARIDPRTNAVTTVAVGHGGELCVDAHDDGVWVSDDQNATVTHLAPSGAVVATIPVGNRPADGTRGPD